LVNKLLSHKAVPWVLAVATGLLLGAAQPKIDWNILAWFAWIPLILAVRGQSPRRVFLLAYAAHAVAFTILLYWIEVVVRVYGNVPIFFAFIPMAMLVAYCAVWMSLAFWWARKVELRYPRLNMLWTLPVFLTAGEWLRGQVFTGFPWGHGAYSQYRNLEVIQITEVVGVDGVLFLLVAASVGAVALADRLRTGRGGAQALVAVALIAVTLVYGNLRLATVRSELAESKRTVRVGLLQGNIEQAQKWDADFREKTLDIYERLTDVAVAQGAQLVIWPETAAPFYYAHGQRGPSQRLENLARRTATYTLFGAPASEEIDGHRYYRNRAYLLNPAGDLLGHYDKSHLVPFSEYVPLPWLFGWIQKLIPVVGSFAAGENRHVLAVPGARFGVLICYESIFPDEVRRFVQNGADFLTIITNDAWFLRTSAAYQHIGMAVLRAVENRVPVLQAGNTGVTAVIGPDGAMRPALPIFEEDTLVETLTLIRKNTFFTGYGEAFAYATLLFSAITIVLLMPRRRREEGESGSPKPRGEGKPKSTKRKKS
jgi:apolipoprotein N-acyltransferase